VSELWPPVWAVILNWNSTPDALECLAGLQRSTYPRLSIVVVDNASTDGGGARVRAEYPNVHVIENETNLGYAEGNNVGLRWALGQSAQYLLLLNPDTVVPPEAIGQLVAAAEQEADSGIVGPLVISALDHAQQFVAAIDWASGQAGEQPITPGSLTGNMEVDYVTGCALMVKSGVVERIGLLDPRYFAYYEDADWCLRCHRAGFRVLVVGGAIVYHKGTPDAAQHPSASTWYYYTRNQRLFDNRYVAQARRAPVWLRYVRFGLQTAFNAIQTGDTVKAEAVLDGLWAGLAGRFGPRRRYLPAPVRAIAFRLAPAAVWAITVLEWMARRFPARAARQALPTSTH
jgi:GT2 family glycosyltransferase